MEAKTAEAEKKREGEKSARVKAEKINEKLAAETAELEDALVTSVYLCWQGGHTLPEGSPTKHAFCTIYRYNMREVPLC